MPSEDKMSKEVRDYVYLDPASLDSWYASLNGWVPETQRKQHGSNVNTKASAEAGGKIGSGLLQFFGDLSAKGKVGGSVGKKRMTDTASRLIDQGLHTELRQELSDNGMIKSLDEDLKPGDVVEITGKGMTDPSYRALFALSRILLIEEFEDSESEPQSEEELINEILEFDEDQETTLGGELQDMLNILYGNNVCLLLDIDDDENATEVYSQCGMILDRDSLEVDVDEFLTSRKYTVLGRVTECSKDGEWDYVEILRVANSVFEGEEMSEFDNLINGFFEEINNDKDLSIDDSLFKTDEPLVVIKPVAVYW